MGVTFCAAAPAASGRRTAAKGDNLQPLPAFIENAKAGGTTEQAELAIKEKEGLPTGLTVIHPPTGAQVPVRWSNYVLMSAATARPRACPRNDERDFAFAKKYGLPVKQVVSAPKRGPFPPTCGRSEGGDGTARHVASSPARA